MLNSQEQRRGQRKAIKCVIWDLDNTIWDGVLLEHDCVSLRENVVAIIKALDARGILHSVASRNDYATAIDKLRQFGLEEYFLYPQINWNTKVSSIRMIAQSLNIGLDAVAFIDDQPFELEEVKFTLPEVLCIDGNEVGDLPARPEMNPRFITPDSRLRRRMYLDDFERRKSEEEFVGSQEEFLSTLRMSLSISAARETDLQRAEELTLRTNQLNSTGYTYSYEELDYFRQSARHELWMASLSDKFGNYGNIGLTLLDCGAEAWVIKLLLMSCRVMSRGIGTMILNYIMRRAKDKGVRLLAEFVPTDKNRMMYVSYKFAGFKEVEKRGDVHVFENDLSRIQPCPPYVKLRGEQ